VLNSSELDSLAKQLASVVASFGLSSMQFGHPDVVREASEQAAQVFQGYAKARPSEADAYAAALAFMLGRRLDERQVDLVASALSERIREQSGARPLGHSNFPGLLDTYGREARAGTLWRLTWFGLLGSYFAFDPHKAPAGERAGWSKLRVFLERTWPLIDRQSGTTVVPDWVKVVRDDPELLGDKAAHKYALDYMRGDEAAIKRLAEDLGIPESSWFWQELVLSAVRRSADLTVADARFKASIPQLLKLIHARPVYRDEALEIMLTRYHRCSDTSVHPQFRDYVVRGDVWQNPKLREAGLATAWNRVEDDVWRMALQWVNEANLKDFFAILAARRNADEGRLEFWSQYMDQISWTRLIFSAQTRALAHSNEGIRNLIAREEGSYATMSSNTDVDAFMMQVGDYIMVEFSKVPNAAYVYKADELPFEPYDREYAGTTADLKHGFQGARAARFTHQPGWATEARRELEQLGVSPDQAARSARQRVTQPAAERSGSTRRSATGRTPNRGGPTAGQPDAPRGARFNMDSLRRLVAQYPRARIDDRRTPGAGAGRLWVDDPMQNTKLERSLKEWGFRWGQTRRAWYYAEN